MSLSPQQVEHYREHGYLIAPDILDGSDLAPLIRDIESWIEQRAAELKAAGKLGDTHPELGFDQRFAALYEQCPEINDGFDIMHVRGEGMFAFLFTPNLLDAVESLIGPEIACNPIQHIRPKLPAEITGDEIGGYQNVPWHQDAGVTWEEADDTEIVTCWIPLVDATEANGCMRILPDVFRRGYLEHQAEGGTTIRPDVFPDDMQPVVAECPRGGVVFMDKHTPHMGLLNRSDRIRWSADLRYQPTGEPTGRPFWPEVIVRSRRDPALVQDDYAEWCHSWDEALRNSQGIKWHRTVPPEERVPAGKWPSAAP